MNTELIRDMAALCGLELSLERAAALIPALEPVFIGDAAIIALELGTLSPLETAPLETAPPEAGHD